MANRHTLHINHLEGFKAFLANEGFDLGDPKGDYAVLYAKKGSRTVILYRRNDTKQHLTVQDRDMRLVRRYLDERKEKENEDKRIGRTTS